MNDALKTLILKATQSKAISSSIEIQPLWSGYGQILRCELAGGNHRSVVVKHVQLPDETNHPRGWNTNLSHERKLKSYHVEMSWYSDLAKQCDRLCRVPQIFHLSDQTFEMLMVMEDLNTVGYPIRKSELSMAEMKVCLNWLAHFHAKFMGTKSDQLWEVGTYWHLNTRPDEWEAMQDHELKAAAQSIDRILNQAKYQTLVHGDAKLANFCFSADGQEVAAVDFQYIGHGCGMKDVAYFLSSCLHENDLTICESELLNFYFEALKKALVLYNQSIDFEEIQQEWSRLYDYAWADFYRFLDGWSPGHWKMHDYSKKIKEKVIHELANS
ncbi:MAG: oxidoreductase family protein [Reichenbachiella sp.]|uniref:oxidoreductase family protein n=1 Tax=Reichenbachiella sp. TaxID=2184521 RepID=UPI00329A752C